MLYRICDAWCVIVCVLFVLLIAIGIPYGLYLDYGIWSICGTVFVYVTVFAFLYSCDHSKDKTDKKGGE